MTVVIFLAKSAVCAVCVYPMFVLPSVVYANRCVPQPCRDWWIGSRPWLLIGCTLKTTWYIKSQDGGRLTAAGISHPPPPLPTGHTSVL